MSLKISTTDEAIEQALQDMILDNRHEFFDTWRKRSPRSARRICATSKPLRTTKF